VEEVTKKALRLSGEIFYGGVVEKPSSAWPNFFPLIFGQRTKSGGGQIRRLRGLVCTACSAYLQSQSQASSLRQCGDKMQWIPVIS